MAALLLLLYNFSCPYMCNVNAHPSSSVELGCASMSFHASCSIATTVTPTAQLTSLKCADFRAAYALTACWPGFLLPPLCRCSHQGPPASPCVTQRASATWVHTSSLNHARNNLLQSTYPSLGTCRSTRNWYSVHVGETIQSPFPVLDNFVESYL